MPFGILANRDTARRGTVRLQRLAALTLPALFVLHWTFSWGQQTPGIQQSTSVSSQFNSSFVERDGAQLQLGGKPFYFTGANFYSAMVNAAGGEMTRQQTTAIFQNMQSLGLTVLRTWAFNDYGVNNTWQALQTSPQVFSEEVFSQGLDWIISEAPKYNIKLLLTLANYQQGYGGAYQYVKWANGTVIMDFFTNPTIVGWYQNNVKTIVTRVNSITGLAYTDDPAIFGWELINEPHVPGDDTGNILTSTIGCDGFRTCMKLQSQMQMLTTFKICFEKWIDDQSRYLKTLDSNHLVGVGVEGFYGQSTPSRLPDNPASSLAPDTNGGNPAPFAGVCEGQDFKANHALQAIDFTSIHLYPDFWAMGNLTAQLEFTAQYINGHLAETTALEKPLIIGEFGKYPPLADRNRYLSYVYGIAATSAASGGPLAGTMVWQLASSPEFPYNFGFDAFSIYSSAAPYTEPPPAGYLPPTERAGINAALQEFYGWAEQVACADKHKNNPRGLLSASPSASDGWNDTLSIIRRNSADMAAASGRNQAASVLPNAVSG